MSTFIALYRGDTVTAARMVAVSADPQLVSEFAARLLTEPIEPDDAADPVRTRLEEGRRRALRLVANEEPSFIDETDSIIGGDDVG